MSAIIAGVAPRFAGHLACGVKIVSKFYFLYMEYSFSTIKVEITAEIAIFQSELNSNWSLISLLNNSIKIAIDGTLKR